MVLISLTWDPNHTLPMGQEPYLISALGLQLLPEL